MKTVLVTAAAVVLAAACAQTAEQAPVKAAKFDTSQPVMPPPPPPGPPVAVAGSTSLAAPADAPPVKAQAPGPYKVVALAEASLMSHTVYRPETVGAVSGKLPVVAWGNGACSNAGLLFQNYLRQLASHGYLVIASGPKDAPMPSFSSGAGGESVEAPNAAAGIVAGRTKDEDLLKAIDWAVAENARAGSPLFGKVDTDKIAVMGQSCGGLQATAVAADPRIDTVVIWNSGTFTPGTNSPGASMSGATKDSIAKFHAPVAYFPGGPSDLAYANSKDDFSRVTTVPAFFGSINVGHGGTFRHPGGGWFGEVGLAWLDWRLKGDANAAKYFEGADCKLCTNPIWEVSKKNMK